MLIVYSKDYENRHHVSNLIDKSGYCIGVKGEAHMNSAHAVDDWCYFICYSFPTETSIYLATSVHNGFWAGQIYLIKGIKF